MTEPNALREHALDELMARVVPLAEAPSGEPLPAEQLVALVERRLLPEEEAEALARLQNSPAARVELRALFPNRYTELLGDARPSTATGGGNNVLRFPLRPALAGAATFAAAAAITLLMWPYAPPTDTGFEIASAGSVVRSAHDQAADRVVARPGQRVSLLMRLGEPGAFDRLRGATAWGALYRVDHRGEASLVCTSERGCQRGAGTLGHLFHAPEQDGRTNRFVFVSGSKVVDPADARAIAEAANARGGGWPALRDALEHAATERGWRLHPQRPIVVGGGTPRP